MDTINYLDFSEQLLWRIAMRIREVEVRYKSGKNVQEVVSSPEDVARFMRDKVRGLCREKFFMLGVDNKNRVNVWEEVSSGTVSEAVIHPREVFQAAILCNCSSIILCHNHPSGVLAPSAEDKATTKRMKEAGEILGIPILDHVIVSESGYYSLKEEGWL